MSLGERTRPGLGIIEPCLPSPAERPPTGPGWLHEIKHDTLYRPTGLASMTLSINSENGL
jgi:hypothetical protein